jgi:hypothetical protein
VIKAYLFMGEVSNEKKALRFPSFREEKRGIDEI